MAKSVPSKLSTTFDEYVIVRQLGQGGAGTVFEAKSSDGSTVAIKILREGLSLEKTKRFKNEIAFCQSRWHAGIINVLDHGIEENGEQKKLFYVMPLYPKTFREFISAEKNPIKLLSAFTQILDAIEAAHLRNCFHRDIKPENILVSADGNAFVISDFGIAHFEEEDLVTTVETQHASRLANFQYAAPEQRQKGAVVDKRADIFALGLLLNEMFTGDVPHGVGHKTIATVSPAHAFLDEVVGRMMQQSPANRYQSIEEIKGDLQIKGQVAISLQKVNEIKKIIVPDSDVSDHPLVANPVKIISVDHNGVRLVCKLNHHVPSNWQHVFQNGGANTWTSMHHWDMVNFNGDTIMMDTPIDYAAEAKGLVDQWIKNTNNLYPQFLAREQQKHVQQKRRELEGRAEFEAKRQAFLSKIKI